LSLADVHSGQTSRMTMACCCSPLAWDVLLVNKSTASFGEPSMACTTCCHGMEGAEGADAILHALSLTLWALSASLDPP